MEVLPRSNCGQKEVIDHEPVEVCGSFTDLTKAKRIWYYFLTSAHVDWSNLFRHFNFSAVRMNQGTANEFRYCVTMMILLMLLLMVMMAMTIIPCSRVLLAKLTVPQLIKKKVPRFI
jgi:hypothetical protein